MRREFVVTMKKWSVFCGDKKESMRGREEGFKEKGCLINLILEKR